MSCKSIYGNARPRNHLRCGIEGDDFRLTAARKQAQLGINPKIALSQSATAYSMTIRQLSEKYLKDYVHSKALDSGREPLRGPQI